jgi:hypothetical protein
MSTRANIFICDHFLTEIASDAYPIRDMTKDAWSPNSLWALMLKLNEQKATHDEFEAAVKEYVSDIGPSYWSEDWGGISNGVGNWSYEYMWVPFEQPDDFTDWENWRGRIFVRDINSELTWKRFGSSYYQIPDRWIYIEDWWLEQAIQKAVDKSDTN